MSDAWTKQPPIEAHYGGCLNCGPRPALFPPEGVVAVGFGYAALHKDGEAVWTEGEMIADNFWNGALWEIGLSEFRAQLARAVRGRKTLPSR